MFVLLNLGAWFYCYTFKNLVRILFGTPEQFWLLFIVNTSLLVLWEMISSFKRNWMPMDRWPPRIPGLLSGASITMLCIQIIFSENNASNPVWTFPVFVAWVVVMYMRYRIRMLDLFLLTLVLFFVIACTAAAIGRFLLEYFDDDAIGVASMMAIFFISVSTAAVYWLRTIARGVKS